MLTQSMTKRKAKVLHEPQQHSKFLYYSKQYVAIDMACTDQILRFGAPASRMHEVSSEPECETESRSLCRTSEGIACYGTPVQPSFE